MAALNLVAGVLAGAEKTFTAVAAGGDTLPLPSAILVDIKNAHATDARTITITAAAACNQGTLHNATVSVPALKTYTVKISDIKRFANSSGRVALTYSDSGADLSLVAYPAS